MRNSLDGSPSYVKGDPWCICQRTGHKVRMSQTRLEWDGLRVWVGAWEARHPQDYVRGRKDDMSVKGALPRSPDVFLAPGDVTPGDL